MSGYQKYQQDRSWSDRFIPMVKAIIAPHLLKLGDAPIERDLHEASDLIVLTVRNVATIGVRLRRWESGYWSTFPDQFTIRCERDNGAVTELEKIKAGWGDWLFYGHAGDAGIHPWMLLDLAVLRDGFSRQSHLLQIDDARCASCGRKSNGDGTHFAWFDRSKMPHALTIATHTTSSVGWV
jgi:hypothetical protein